MPALRRRLTERGAPADPFTLFSGWLAEARATGQTWSDAFVIATASPRGAPSARAVLLRAHDERGPVFFTDTRSRKGRELARNARAAVVFLWPEQRRQARVEGTVAKIADAEAEAYFRTRPRGHRIAAWASHQDAVIGGREVLERRVRALRERYRGRSIRRPSYWTGYRVRPLAFEFWQSRPDRLHDRLRYTLRRSGGWLRQRLSP